MTAAPMRRFIAPPRYVQGPGALRELPDILAEIGRRPLVVTDPDVERLMGEQLQEVLRAQPPPLCLRGAITASAVARLAEEARSLRPDVILGIGGGKALDAGKGVARDLGLPYISVPTIASNDAATSRAIAHYDENDGTLKVGTLGRNPDAVVVDTDVIVRAPVRFLRCGIGDALAKAQEAEACATSPAGRTLLGSRPSASGLALAQACHAILRTHAAAALTSAAENKTDPAFEAVVEAVILMSGLGFENGGLSVAHAMTRGLMLAPRTRAYAHGEHVAYGLLVQLALDADDATLADEQSFVHSIGLPVRLHDFAAGSIEASEYEFLAQKALTASQHIRNYPRTLNAAALVRAIERVEGLPTAAREPACNLPSN